MSKMRNCWMLCGVLVLMLTACRLDNVKWTYGNGQIIEPGATIVKKEFRQQPFDEVDISVVANVKIIQSDSTDYRVVLSCPDNYVELFRFERDGQELEVNFVRDNVNIHPTHVDITIYTPQLRSLDNSGASSIEITRLNADRLEVDNSGVGTLYLSGLRVHELEADCSGVGSIELSGEAGKADLDCSGVGSIKAEELKAREVRAEVSGVGSIRCHASERIDAWVSGVGGVKYGGKPKDKQLRRDGVGEIVEL